VTILDSLNAIMTLEVVVNIVLSIIGWHNHKSFGMTTSCNDWV